YRRGPARCLKEGPFGRSHGWGVRAILTGSSQFGSHRLTSVPDRVEMVGGPGEKPAVALTGNGRHRGRVVRQPVPGAAPLDRATSSPNHVGCNLPEVSRPRARARLHVPHLFRQGPGAGTDGPGSLRELWRQGYQGCFL